MTDFFIKEDYKSRDQNLTLDTGVDPKYWTEARVREAGQFQYYVYEYCLKLIKKHKLKSFMDVGCGAPVKVKQLISPHCPTITLVDQPTTKRIANKILPSARFISADLETIEMPLPEKHHIIVCADVLEHLVNPDMCMNFINANLEEEGFLVISTPERDFLRGENCMASPKPEHVREWNRDEFSQYIQSHKVNILEQFLVPQKKASFFENVARQMTGHFIQVNKWKSCQFVVCQKEPSNKNLIQEKALIKES